MLNYDYSNEQFLKQGQQDYSDIEFTLAPKEKYYARNYHLAFFLDKKYHIV